jgi:hypothetical protein
MNYDPRLAWTVRIVMSLMLFALGAFLLGLATGVVAPAEESVNTPGWMVGIGGAVFLVSGVAVLMQHRPAAGWFAAMVILVCGAAAGLYIGLFADPANIEGGVPFVSREANERIGRAVFALGGVVCLALLAWGLWLGPDRQRQE